MVHQRASVRDRLPSPGHLGVVAVGGAVGALLRVALAEAFPPTDAALPLVTLAENIVGAFLLALLLTWFTERYRVEASLRLLLCTGVLGSFTTYSTLAVELDRLLAGGHLGVAAVYVAASLFGGLAAAVAGLRLGRRLPPDTPGRDSP